jgi:hypothetical protein
MALLCSTDLVIMPDASGVGYLRSGLVAHRRVVTLESSGSLRLGLSGFVFFHLSFLVTTPFSLRASTASILSNSETSVAAG